MFAEYANRDRVLADMGFSSYSDYLKSPIWKTVRNHVMLRFGGRCRCGAPATQVHHDLYNRGVMLGKVKHLKHLHPVCATCHQNAEIDRGRKTSPSEANENLGVNDKITCTKCGRRKRKEDFFNGVGKFDVCKPCRRTMIKNGEEPKTLSPLGPTQFAPAHLRMKQAWHQRMKNLRNKYGQSGVKTP